MMDEYHDHLEPIVIEDKPDHPLKKIIIGFFGLFLVLLMLFYIIVPYVPERIYSNTLSQELQQVHESTHYTIYLSQGVIDRLKQDYLSDYLFEKKWCLLGKKKGNKLTIDTIYMPTVIERNVTFVRTSGCPPATLIGVHSHPFRSCIPSQQDLKSFGYSQQLVMGIMCDKDQIAFFS